MKSQVRQLQRGLEIFRRWRCPAHPCVYVDMYGDDCASFPASSLLRSVGDKPPNPPSPTSDVAQRGVAVVLLAAQSSVPPRANDVKVIWSLRKSVGFSQTLDAIRQRQHGHADLRNLTAAGHRAGRRRLRQQFAAGDVVRPRGHRRRRTRAQRVAQRGSVTGVQRRLLRGRGNDHAIACRARAREPSRPLRRR